MRKRRKTHLRRQPAHRVVNPLIMVTSIAICLLLSLNRWPGISLEGIGPNWLLIWLIVWSIDRTLLQGIFAGICLGLLQDGLTAPWPTHALGFGLVGGISVLLYNRRFWKTDLLMTPLLVMVMVALNEGILLLQFAWGEGQSLSHLWQQQYQIFWIGPLLSGLLTPALYWPLQQWWSYLERLRLQKY